MLYARARIGHGGAERYDLEFRIDGLGVHDGKIVDIPDVGIQKERCLLADWAAQRPDVLNGIVTRIFRASGGSFGEVRIPGIERRVIGVDGE